MLKLNRCSTNQLNGTARTDINSFSSDDLFENAHFTDVFIDSVSDLIRQLVRKQDDFHYQFFVSQRVETNPWTVNGHPQM